MRRSAQRILAVVTGLVLGWYLAGVLPGMGASLAFEQAGESPHAQTGRAADQPHSDRGALPPSSYEGHLDHSSPHENDALPLVPKPHDMTWFRAVVWSAAGLFVAAIVLGIPALKLKGEEPPEPVAGHDDDHSGHESHPAHHDSLATHAHH